MGGIDKWEVLGKFKMAIKKIKFLLNFTTKKWKLASTIIERSSNRRLSFNDDRPGLRTCVPEEDINGHDSNNDGSGSSGRSNRTTSYPSEDDVDKRADAFIANFYRQLKYERQVSLELRYSEGNIYIVDV